MNFGRFIVDALTNAALLAMAFGVVGPDGHVSYALLISGALLGIGFVARTARHAARNGHLPGLMRERMLRTRGVLMSPNTCAERWGSRRVTGLA